MDISVPEVVARPTMSLSAPPLTVDVDEVMTITGVPVGAVVTHRDGETVVDDGSLEWSSNVVGRFYFAFDLFPYQQEFFFVEVIA